jgi:dUTPase
VDELARSASRFYIRSGTQILEIEFAELSSRIVVTASHCVADVLGLASKLYEGCAIQSMLGSMFVSLLPRSKAGYQVRIKELDRYKIVDAKFDGGVLMVIGATDGRYDRLVFRFDEDYTEYDLRTVEDIEPSGLNFIALSTGICVALVEDEKLEAFQTRKGSAGIRVVEDSALGNDMRLTKVQGKVGFTRGDRIYQMSLK